MRREGERSGQAVLFLLLIAFALACVFAVAPQWHEQLHNGAASPSHQCAVTLLAEGRCEVADTPPSLCHATQQLHTAVPVLSTTALPQLFRGAALLEHAPPAFS